MAFNYGDTEEFGPKRSKPPTGQASYTPTYGMEQPTLPPSSAYPGSVGNYGVSPFGGVNWGSYLNQFGNAFQGMMSQQRSPEELDRLRQVGDLAQKFGGGAEGYQQALKYFGDNLKSNQSAWAAAASDNANTAQVYSGAQKGIESQGGLSAGARATQAAELAREEAGKIGGSVLAKKWDSAKELGSLGLEGGKIAAQTSLDLMKLSQDRMLTAASLAAHMTEAAAQINLQSWTNYSTLNLDAAKASDAAQMQLYFGNRSADLAEAGFREGQYEFGEQQKTAKEAFDWYTKTMWPQQLSAQKQAGKEQMISGIVQGVGGIVPG